MVTHFYHYAQIDRSPHSLLKGYNTQFSTYQELKVATENSELTDTPGHPLYNIDFDLRRDRTFFVIMVFYSDPIVELALKNHEWGYFQKPNQYSLSYEEIRNAFRTQLASFHKADGFRFIFEIVFSGLGLGYNVQDGTARNPMDGTPLKDPEVIFQSRVDRAMIDMAIELKEVNEMAILSSCTRLCDVRTPKGVEITWNMKTGEPTITPDGEQGLAKRLRAIHGGLYPQSDLVVADDPYAEVAARTWIDELAGLDRSKLLHMTYNEWLEEGEEKVPGLVAAVKKLNDPFLPNQFDGPLDDDLKIVVDQEATDGDFQGRTRQWWWVSLLGPTIAGVAAWAFYVR